MDTVDGVDSKDGSVLKSNSNSDGAILDELMDTDDTVDIVDGVRLSVTAGSENSAWTGVGEGTLGSNERLDCVGVSSEDGGDGSVYGDDGLTSVMGVSIADSSDDWGVPLGRRKDVSKEVSGPSGRACEAIEGDARRSEDSYDWSDSAPHADSGMAGLDGVSGCEIVDGTVGVSWLEGVGVTSDSVGLEMVESDTVGSRSEIGRMGDGPGIDSVGDSSELSSMVDGVGMENSSDSGDEGVSSRDGSVGDVGVSVVGEGARSVGVCSDGSLGIYVEGGRGTNLGSSSSSYSRIYGDGAEEGIVGISDGALMLISSASSTLGLHLHSAVLKSVDTSDGQTSAVVNSVGAGVVHTGMVWNSVSATSESHFGAVSYSVSTMAVS